MAADSDRLRAALDAEGFDRPAYLDYTHGTKTKRTRAAKAHYTRVRRRLGQEEPRGRNSPSSHRRGNARVHPRRTVDAGPSRLAVTALLTADPRVCYTGIARATGLSVSTVTGLALGTIVRVRPDVEPALRAVRPAACRDRMRRGPRVPHERRVCAAPGCRHTFTCRASATRRFCSEPCRWAASSTSKMTTRGQVREGLTAAAAALGPDRVTITAYNAWCAGADQPCVTTVLRVYGTWNAALVAAGLPTRRGGPSGRRPLITDDEMLTVVGAALAAGVRTEREYAAYAAEHRGPCSPTVRRRFGGWPAAVRAATARSAARVAS